MAYSDYRLCDKCGCKAFYDVNLNYEYKDKERYIRGEYVALDYVGDWAVLCIDCSKKYKCEIVEIE